VTPRGGRGRGSGSGGTHAQPYLESSAKQDAARGVLPRFAAALGPALERGLTSVLQRASCLAMPRSTRCRTCCSDAAAGGHSRLVPAVLSVLRRCPGGSCGRLRIAEAVLWHPSRLNMDGVDGEIECHAVRLSCASLLR
jgi:hypothetical protein